MNSSILNVYKPLGKTSLEMIEILRSKYPEYTNQKISFAGRLDPMAQGVLILLVGDKENKNRRAREKAKKIYKFTMILGISSDSYDICGIPTLSNNEPNLSNLASVVQKYKGEIIQELPKYSAYVVRGKPMYVRVADNTLKDDEIPKLKRHIYSIEILKVHTESGRELLNEISTRISLIKRGDFRQEKILKKYNDLLKEEQSYTLVDLVAEVSSGTYIRSLCNDIGNDLKCSAISLEITRTKSGDFNIEDSLHIC